MNVFCYSPFPIPDSRFPIPDSLLPIPDSRFPTPDSRFPIPDSRFPIKDTINHLFHIFSNWSRLFLNSITLPKIATGCGCIS
ncbi:hypothetical protein [Moorena sp. SIO3I6]|uniref:hypothetical protein n=1 Tax=Moorena sp. SIO3I6 TaxID=2607831 RepID=UPI0013F91038|nr:hypothetical protein [Moorena sp. SIO3I6]NEP26204.1 hypothetical protein [Moorena sp. SIO3I6]